MRKKTWITIVAVLLCFCILAGCANSGDSKPDSAKLSLDEFQTGGEYMYKGIAWGTDEKTAREALPFALTEDPARVGGPEEYDFFVSKGACELDGAFSVVRVEFYNGGLSMLSCEFYSISDPKAWFEQEVSKATQLYGEHTNFEENVTEKRAYAVYSWRTEQSQFQLSLFEPVSGDAYVLMGLAQLPPPGA